MTLYPGSLGDIFTNHSLRSVCVVVGVQVYPGDGGDIHVTPGGTASMDVRPGDTRYALFTVPAGRAIHVDQPDAEHPTTFHIGVEVFAEV